MWPFSCDYGELSLVRNVASAQRKKKPWISLRKLIWLSNGGCVLTSFRGNFVFVKFEIKFLIINQKLSANVVFFDFPSVIDAAWIVYMRPRFSLLNETCVCEDFGEQNWAYHWSHSVWTTLVYQGFETIRTSGRIC